MDCEEDPFYVGIEAIEKVAEGKVRQGTGVREGGLSERFFISMNLCQFVT